MGVLLCLTALKGTKPSVNVSVLILDKSSNTTDHEVRKDYAV